jgi:hypothetical protein
VAHLGNAHRLNNNDNVPTAFMFSDVLPLGVRSWLGSGAGGAIGWATTQLADIAAIEARINQRSSCGPPFGTDARGVTARHDAWSQPRPR